MISKKNLLNLFSLASIQGSNALIPIIIYPIILNKIGFDLFSKVTITEAISAIVSSFAMYSFDINGVSKLAGLNFKNHKSRISIIFSNIFYTRILIMVLLVCLLPLSSIFLDKTSLHLLFFWLFVPLSSIFQSLWLFQGLELNIEAAIITLISRLLSISLLFLLIQKPSDFLLIPIILGIGYLLGGIASWMVLIIKYDIRLLSLKQVNIKQYLLEGKDIFIGNVSVILFRDLNVILLGVFMVDSTAISIYSIAEKFIKGLQASIRPLNQFFFPKVILKLKGIVEPDRRSFIIIMKQTIPQLIILLMISIFIHIGFYFVDNSTDLILSYPNKYRIYNVVTIMNISVFFGVLNFMLGSAGLNFLNERKYFSTSIFIVGVVSIVSCTILTTILSEYGAVFSFILSEVLLFVLIVKRFFMRLVSPQI